MTHGDLISLVQHTIQALGPNTIRITEVRGHATHGEVERGQARVEDQFGNTQVLRLSQVGGTSLR